jgi:5'-methylthioadenosine phosphorylase
LCPERRRVTRGAMRGKGRALASVPDPETRDREPMIDIGVTTGSGVYELPGAPETHVVENAFGEAKVAVTRVGPWTVGSISRHQSGHHHLPHTIPYQANLTALKQLGARAVLATTAVGAVDPGVHLGRPILFDDLFFPANLLPNGEACTIFTLPGDPERGHLIWTEPFAPRLRRKLGLAAGELGLEIASSGIYAHTNGPRFETRAEIRWLGAAGVTAVSQTCGPEVVLAGELGIAYGLVGFPVNYATGVAEHETREELGRLLALSSEVLPRLVLRATEILEAEDLMFDHGYVYRVEGGV